MASEIAVNEDNTDLVLNALNRQILAGLESIGLLAERYAKAECPVDTGRLRNSITHSVESGEKAVYIGTNVEYASYVELGTRHQKAQPYLTPAATNHGSQYRSIMKSALQNG